MVREVIRALRTCSFELSSPSYFPPPTRLFCLRFCIQWCAIKRYYEFGGPPNLRGPWAAASCIRLVYPAPAWMDCIGREAYMDLVSRYSLFACLQLMHQSPTTTPSMNIHQLYQQQHDINNGNVAQPSCNGQGGGVGGFVNSTTVPNGVRWANYCSAHEVVTQSQ